ncbi:hypothetical protein ACLB1N_10190 [Escherichia coli]
MQRFRGNWCRQVLCDPRVSVWCGPMPYCR